MSGLEPATLTPTMLANSNDLETVDSHKVSSPFGRIILTTEAETFRVDCYSDLNISNLRLIGVWVDGSFVGNLTPDGNGAQSLAVLLGSSGGSSRTIEIVSGPTSRSAAPVKGSWPITVTASKPITQIFDTATPRLVIYGDSISVGDGAESAAQEDAYPVLVRESYSGSVSVEAWGFRGIYTDGRNSTVIDAFVTTIGEYNPDILYMHIGTNDYGIELCSAADFETYYGDVLDALNAAYSSLVIYCQTPLVRSDETANTFGDTLDDYRTAISNAVSTRTSFATLVDGSSIITTDDLDDGTHPNSTGHSKIATSILSLLS